MRLPLLSGWRLVPGADAPAGLSGPSGDGPAPAREEASVPGGEPFALPGADELAGFSDLLGGNPAPAREEESEQEGEPFALPGCLPPELAGEASLGRVVDFGAAHGGWAQIVFARLAGRGRALLGGEPAGEFDGGPLVLDATAALRRGKKLPLTLRFDAPEDGAQEPPARGVPGPVWLRVARHARLNGVSLLPDARATRVRARVCAARDGEYLLEARFLPPRGETVFAELSVALEAGAEQTCELTLDACAAPFVPGEPYDAPCVRVRLWLRAASGAAVPGALCDEELLACGRPGPAPRLWLPLSAADCALPPQTLAERLSAAHIPCVALPAQAADDALMLALTRTGIATRVHADGEEKARFSRFACAVFEADASPDEPPRSGALAARDLCSMTAYPRPAEAEPDAAALLAEAAGRAVDPDGPRTRDVLAWLRAVAVRLCAEALRQGALSGALCAPGEWVQPDIAAALTAALAPLHLSALPLYGAWWTCSRFSAVLHAFIPDGEAGLTAEAALEGENGERLAHARYACPPGGGRLGLIEAALPAAPCVLTLRARLMRGETVAEESAFPVYVGERGPLERAF